MIVALPPSEPDADEARRIPESERRSRAVKLAEHSVNVGKVRVTIGFSRIPPKGRADVA